MALGRIDEDGGRRAARFDALDTNSFKSLSSLQEDVTTFFCHSSDDSKYDVKLPRGADVTDHAPAGSTVMLRESLSKCERLEDRVADEAVPRLTVRNPSDAVLILIHSILHSRSKLVHTDTIDTHLVTLHMIS